MSITRAQIARQLLAEGGKIGNTTFQLARKRPDGKKPGYYGPDAGEGGMESDFGQDTYSTSDVDFGGVSGGTDQQFADTRAAIEARTPKETLGQKIVNQLKNISKFSPSLNIFKGIGNLFDKFQNLRGFNPDGTRRTQAQFEQARRDRINQNRISNILGRDAPFTLQTLENLAKLGYTGPLDKSLIGSTNITRSATPNDVYPDRVEGIVTQAPEEEEPNFRKAMAELNLQRGITNTNVANNLVAEQLSFPYDFMNTGDPFKDNLYAPDGTYKPGNNLVAEQLSFPFDTFNTGDPFKDNLYDQDGNYKPSLNNLSLNNLFADVSQADLMLNKSRGSNLYSLDDFREFSGNKTLTQEELDGIRDGTIKAPTGRFIT